MSWAFDEDALIAAVELVNRTGATKFEFGHTGDDDSGPDDDVTWWATAHYKGTRVTVENHHDPVAAAEQLARRLLRGGKCVGCQREIALSTLGHQGKCRWTREGPHWMPACSSGRRRVQDRIDQAAKQSRTTNEGN